MLGNLVMVAVGGALGSSARYLTGIGIVRLFGHGFPWGTVVVNALGSFLMGALIVVLSHHLGGTRLAPFLMTGVLGGFTTFSAFSLDALTLYERGQGGLALVYVGGTLTLTLGGIALGVVAARWWYA